MNFKSILARFVFLLLLPVISCEPNNEESKVYSINGYAQKGPFVVGSSVTISELNDKLVPTGRVYFSTVLDDKGYFELPGVTLSSPFIQIKVEGKYFGEATGAVQSDELILYSIADVRQGQNINVNIITHLIKRRIEKLVQDDSQSFEDAKSQAFEELLETFNWSDLSIDEANQLNITDENAGGSTLLALSIIFDNIFDPVARLKTITDFQTDLGDGNLDSQSTQSTLISSAQSLTLKDSTIQANLAFYFGLGNIPDFKEPLNQFVENTEFVNYLDLIFPASLNDKENLISRTDSTLTTSDTYYASITIPAGQQTQASILMIARTNSENNRFTTPAEFWNQSYAQGGVECNDNPNDHSCFESYAALSAITSSEDVTIQIPVTFSGTGIVTLYYSAKVNGTLCYRERKLTW